MKTFIGLLFLLFLMAPVSSLEAQNCDNCENTHSIRMSGCASEHRSCIAGYRSQALGIVERASVRCSLSSGGGTPGQRILEHARCVAPAYEEASDIETKGDIACGNRLSRCISNALSDYVSCRACNAHRMLQPGKS